jgi:hypothetical protein
MRLGILGPAQGNLPALARTAQRLLDELSAEKVLYLADDDALDQVVASWASSIVGADTDEQSIFERAAARCATASSDSIDEFIASEKARLRLKVLVSLPEGRRTIELLGGRVALFVYDRASLDEEDIAGASLLVFGKSEESVVRKVGPRTLLAPGVIGSPTGGFLVLDDSAGGVRVEIMNASGAVTARELVPPPSAAARLFSHGDSKL